MATQTSKRTTLNKPGGACRPEVQLVGRWGFHTTLAGAASTLSTMLTLTIVVTLTRIVSFSGCVCSFLLLFFFLRLMRYARTYRETCLQPGRLFRLIFTILYLAPHEWMNLYTFTSKLMFS